MFIKINQDMHINISDIHKLWESPDKGSFSINNIIIHGYTIEDFKRLYTHCKKNNIHFLDLSIPCESREDKCPTCKGRGINSNDPINNGIICMVCRGKGTIKVSDDN